MELLLALPLLLNESLWIAAFFHAGVVDPVGGGLSSEGFAVVVESSKPGITGAPAILLASVFLNCFIQPGVDGTEVLLAVVDVDVGDDVGLCVGVDVESSVFIPIL